MTSKCPTEERTVNRGVASDIKMTYSRVDRDINMIYGRVDRDINISYSRINRDTNKPYSRVDRDTIMNPQQQGGQGDTKTQLRLST